MARPHIEFINAADVSWQRVTLADQTVEVKYLSRDPEHGNHTALVRLPAGWKQAGRRAHPAPEEFFVISGSLQVGSLTLGPSHYLRVAPGILHGPEEALAETLVLWTLEGPYGPVAGVEPAAADDLVHVDASAIQWKPTWVPGPVPGLHIKLLHMNKDTGAYSRLIMAEAGWKEERMEHHDCCEEAYTLEGEMYMGNAGGTLGKGTYFWRPPNIRHGPMHTAQGALFFLRTDGPLVNHYTSVDGKPL